MEAWRQFKGNENRTGRGWAAIFLLTYKLVSHFTKHKNFREDKKKKKDGKTTQGTPEKENMVLYGQVFGQTVSISQVMSIAINL